MDCCGGIHVGSQVTGAPITAGCLLVGLGWRAVSEGGRGGLRGAEDFVPVEGEAASAHPKTRARDADDGGRPAGPVVHCGAEADATALELLVTDGNSRCPD